jgi:hypothetical protein
MSHKFCERNTAPQRPDCLAGHVRLELRNVAANYPFERSLRFPGIQPNSGNGDYSRLSCGVGKRSSSQMLGCKNQISDIILDASS